MVTSAMTRALYFFIIAWLLITPATAQTNNSPSASEPTKIILLSTGTPYSAKLPLRFPFSSSLGYTLIARPALSSIHFGAARKSFRIAPKRLTTTGKPEKFSGVARQTRHKFRVVKV